VDVDLRVSIAPMQHGEKICMRILVKTKSSLSLGQLGFSPYNLKRYEEIIQLPYGMILHCGPTGSGKSLTLYSALAKINTPDMNISTVEDPIEYTLPGLNQMQARADIGVTFATALRCFLRQDPDVILVGEIRDRETSEIALEAALTGHLVFATLHTNDAPSTISRLVEMKIPAYMVGSALSCVCAQRLIRRLCSNCKKPVEPTPKEREVIALAKDEAPFDKIYQPGTCLQCGDSGYRGRCGIHELMISNDELRELISQNAPMLEIKEAARKAGMRTLFEDGLEKVKAGMTSFREVIGNLRQD
jgi:type IV pilus assembly protein PilB